MLEEPARAGHPPITTKKRRMLRHFGALLGFCVLGLTTDLAQAWSGVNLPRLQLRSDVGTCQVEGAVQVASDIASFSFKPKVLRRREILAAAVGTGLMIIGNPLRAGAEVVEESKSRGGLPSGVVVLRIADVTATMENIMLQAAEFEETGTGDGIVIGRPDMVQSIAILLKQSELEDIPRSAEAVQRLRKISLIAQLRQGPLTVEELRQMAQLYSEARDALRTVFEAFSADEQREFKQTFRKMQEVDRERIRQGMQPEK